MARYYEVKFRHVNTGDTKIIGSQRNTRAAAERTAKRKLGERVDDTSDWYFVSIKHVGEDRYRDLEYPSQAKDT